MAEPTSVNPQITDAVTQTNVKVLGDAPAQAMASLYQSVAHSVGIAMENAVNAQQQIATLSQAAATQGISLLYSVDTAATAVAAKGIPTAVTPPAASAKS